MKKLMTLFVSIYFCTYYKYVVLITIINMFV